MPKTDPSLYLKKKMVELKNSKKKESLEMDGGLALEMVMVFPTLRMLFSVYIKQQRHF